MVMSRGGFRPGEPEPIKDERKLPVPALAAALGMAVSYYGYSLLPQEAWSRRLILAALFILVLIISLLRVFRGLSRKEARTRVSAAGILAAALASGFALGIAAGKTVPAPAHTGLPEENVIALRGILREDPRTLRGGSGFGVLELRECGGAGGVRASAGGSLTVFFPGESIPRLKEFGRGAEIYSDGVLTRGERGLLFRASSVHIVKPASALERFRGGLRLTLLEKFQGRQGAGLVWGSLASALLLGARDGLDTALAEGFRNSGCSHILALSGMHLAIISAALAFLLKGPLGARRASLAGAVFIVFYVFVAGSQPSLVRAALMYVTGTAALWGFLKGTPLSLLAVAFIVQLLFQSGTGLSYSFILSYLALGGILGPGETLRTLFRGRLPEIISGGVSASLGAFALTAPAVALFFGSLKPVGIIAGLFIAPFCSLFMILSLAALAAAFLPFPVWALFDFILTRLYRFLEFLVSLAGKVPGISISNPVPVLIFSLAFWFLILFIERNDSARRNSVAAFD